MKIVTAVPEIHTKYFTNTRNKRKQVMRIKRTLYILFVVAIIAPATVFGQRYSSLGGYSRSDYMKLLKLYESERGLSGGVNNDCLTYYYSSTPADTNKSVFKQVTVSQYFSYDSNMSKKRIISKSIFMFNKKGQQLYSIGIDSSGKVTDSSRSRFDKNFRQVYSAQYNREGDTGVMRATSEEKWVYDKKGNILTDSSYTLEGEEDDEGDGGGASVSIDHHKFDTAGNEIESKHISFSDAGTSDSSMTWSTFDKNNNMTFSLTMTSSDTSKQYYRYNDKLMNVFTAEVSRGDSSYTITKYDTGGNVTERNRYEDGKLSTSYTCVIDPKDKKMTETEEELSTADAMSCPNNTVTVTVTDSSRNVLSEVVTREKDGTPFVTTTLHRYTFDHGRMLYDSSFTIEKGFLHSLTSEKISANKFDKNGNLVSEILDGGGQYSSNSKESWIYNDQSNVMYHATFNTCGSEKPEAEEFYIYYHGGKKVKEVINISEYEKTETFYSKDAKLQKSIVLPVQQEQSDEEKFYATILKKMKKKGSAMMEDMEDRQVYKSTMYEYKK